MSDDSTTFLAKKRTLLAQERTFLAKKRTYLAAIRTGLAIIAIGLAIINLYQQKLTNLIGYSAIASGLFVTIYGASKLIANWSNR